MSAVQGKLRNHTVWRLSLSIVTACLSLPSFTVHAATHGKPLVAVEEDTSPTVHTAAHSFEKLSRYYRFESVEMTALDGSQHYRVTIGHPLVASFIQPDNRSAKPVIYMLDGTAALRALDETTLQGLHPGAPLPVIVTVAHDPEKRQQDRAKDYTPPVANTASPEDQQRYGGANNFWHFLEVAVKPYVAQRTLIDPQQQTLWGHSFGGLFALYTLFNHPQSYQRYVAADPSLWWQDGALLQDEAAYRQRSQRPTGELLVMHSASRRSSDDLGDDATRRLAERLSALPELSVRYHDYFELHHGSVRPASIPSALRLAQGLKN